VLSIRLSDANIYFYTAYQILQGKLLYKDVVFTNLPLLPYFTALYYVILGGNLKLYFMTATVETIVVSFLLYIIFKLQYKDKLLALSGALFYELSYIILFLTDYQPGVFLGNIFLILGYYLYLKKKTCWTGIVLGIALCIKVYFFPVLFAFVVYLFIKDRKNVLKLILGIVIPVVVVILPFLILTPNEFYKDIVVYSLSRTQLFSKVPLFISFIKNDPLLFLLFIFSVINIRKNLLLGLISIITAAAFILYKDVYYIYFNALIPFVVLSYGEVYTAYTKTHVQKRYLLLMIVAFGLLVNVLHYKNIATKLNKIEHFDLIVPLIKKEKPDYIYGLNTLAPAVAYESKVPMLGGIVDTNEGLYTHNIIDIHDLTKKTLKYKTIIATTAFADPVDNNLAIKAGMFDPEPITKNCKIIYSAPVKSDPGINVNRIVLLKCYK
jgi:hypothetical protein